MRPTALFFASATCEKRSRVIYVTETECGALLPRVVILLRRQLLPYAICASCTVGNIIIQQCTYQDVGTGEQGNNFSRLALDARKISHIHGLLELHWEDIGKREA